MLDKPGRLCYTDTRRKEREDKKMTKFRESLLDRMIRIYGFEHEIVLDFAAMCEAWADNDWNNKCLAILVESHEADPVFLED